MTFAPPLRLVSCLALAAMLTIAPLPWHATFDAGAAFAQDDDDGGGDDGGDDGGGDDGGGDDGGGSGGGAGGGDDDDDRGSPQQGDRQPTTRGERETRSPARVTREQQRTTRPRAAAPAPAPRPVFAPEIVTSGLTEADVAVLVGQGFRVIEVFDLPGVGTQGRRLAPPAGLTIEEARDRVRAVPSGFDADFNHFYRTEEDTAAEGIVPAAAATSSPAACSHANCRTHALMGWPDAVARAAQCPVSLEIGVIDTGVNVEHEFLDGAVVEVVRAAGETGDPSGMIHGTAVVSVLAGRPGTRVEGVLPEARYLVADIFVREDGDERADVASLLRALDLMEQRGVRVVNLSLAGPANTALERVVRRLVDERGMVLVAAVGNGGAAQPVAWPAAYDGVIGVTALDLRGRAYRSAQRGPEVDLAAPGVGLLLATSIKGAREQTGTSFAVPFVSAAAALVLAREPDLSPVQVAERLFSLAEDSGAEGRDDVFGYGLLRTDRLCS